MKDYLIDETVQYRYDDGTSGRLDDRGLALARLRKVRTPQSTMPDNIRGGVTCRIGPQKQVALAPTPSTEGRGESGDSEKVV